MKRALTLLFGLFVMNAGLWIGCYLTSVYPAAHWANFPSFFTGFIIVVSGIIIFICGFEGKT